MENNSNTVLVLGANGKTGSRVANKLEALQIPMRRASRNGYPAFNWDDPTTWASVLNGIGSVYITFQPDLAVPGAHQTIAAFTAEAKRMGVRKLVLLSGRGEPEAQQCEQIIIGSGLAYTVVRASWFNQNFSEGYLAEPIMAGFVALPAGDVKEPFIDTDDIADIVVAALTSDTHNGVG